jgi:hypothetical protein
MEFEESLAELFAACAPAPECRGVPVPDPPCRCATRPLLLAAAAPALPHELVGEDAAVAAFRREYRPSRGRRRRLATLAVAVVAALSIGGTAVAATTGRSFFAAAPGVAAHASPAASPTPARLAAAGSPAATGNAELADACRAWLAFRADPHARPVTGAERKELARAASGEPAIDDYCDRRVGSAGSASSGAASSGAESKKPKPSHPAKPSHG